jgi:Tol biopolymer transport system component
VVADVAPAPGSILAPVGRQAAVLNLDAPRPRLLTSLQPPSYAADLDVSPTGQVAVEVRDTGGGDIASLDLTSGTLAPLVSRADADESLSLPAWQADGSRLVFERDDVHQPGVAYPGQANVRYPSRLETVLPDGSSRAVLVADARMPALSADGAELAYVRSSSSGTALRIRELASGDERELLPASRFSDVAYPRYAPDGQTLAFVATSAFVGQLLFGVQVAAFAHGLPWDVWLIDPHGGEPRQLAVLGADDPSIAWSPDGRQLFVYSGSGSAIVDVATHEVARYDYLAGYGAVAWIP